MRDVMITGIGSTRFGKLEGRGVQNIAVEAANAALARSGVERKDIGASLEDAIARLRNSPSSLTKGMMEYANALAGKTNRFDRVVIDSSEHAALGVRAWQALQRIGGRATILGNAQSVLSQTLGLPSTIADVGPVNMIKGLARYTANDTTIEKSNFVTARLTRVDPAVRSAAMKVENALGMPLQKMENEYISLTWYGEYEAALQDGYKGQEAILEADRRTERVVAGRGIADRPEIYRSTIANGFLQYTLEVNAQNQKFWKDFDAKQKGQYMMGAFVMNHLMGMVTGFEPLPDFIEVAMDTFDDFTDEDDERNAKDKAIDGGRRALGEVASMNPFVSAGANSLMTKEQRQQYFGEDSDLGRFPGQAAPIQVAGRAGKVVSSLANREFRNARDEALRVLPAGNQARKTIQGAETISRGYVIDRGGNPTFAGPDNPFEVGQSLLFGQYSTPNAREYFENDRRSFRGEDGERIKELNSSEAKQYIKLLNTQKDAEGEAKAEGFNAGQTRNAIALATGGSYSDYAEQYDLQDAQPSNATGLEAFTEDMPGLSTAKQIVKGTGRFSELPEGIADEWLSRNGFTREDVLLDVAAEEKVSDKADYLTPLIQGKAPQQQFEALVPYLGETLGGNYFASYGTLRELRDRGVITEDTYQLIRNATNPRSTGSGSGSTGSNRRGGSRRGRSSNTSSKQAAKRAISIAKASLNDSPSISINSKTPSIKVEVDDPGIGKKFKKSVS